MPAPLLEVKELQVRRGGSLVLDISSLTVEEGTILSLIGPTAPGRRPSCRLLPA